MIKSSDFPSLFQRRKKLGIQGGNMKRILFVLLLLMLCLSAVFAANNIVSVDIYPFSVQLIDNYGWGNKYSSSLGWGAKAGTTSANTFWAVT